jgi:hypothetical protein
MIAENLENKQKVGTLRKRRVKMADGRRYLIYYTFERSENASPNADESLPETVAQNSTVEEEINV